MLQKKIIIALGVGVLGLATGFLIFPASADIFEPDAFIYDHDTYASWDMDGSGYIDRREFNAYSHDIIDSDDDGIINAGEWDDYTANWYDPYDIDFREFNEYDRDNSGYLEEEEYSAASKETGLYGYWDYDGNGYVTDIEYSDVVSIYADFDADIY